MKKRIKKMQKCKRNLKKIKQVITNTIQDIQNKKKIKNDQTRILSCCCIILVFKSWLYNLICCSEKVYITCILGVGEDILGDRRYDVMDGAIGRKE